MHCTRWMVVVAVCLFSSMGQSAQAQKRVALVVGNSDYEHTVKLANPRNDAADMSAALRGHGFKVIEGLDLGKAAFDLKVRQFATELKGSDAGVFFYAGHGLQVAGQNYLVPVDAKAEGAETLDFEMVRADVVQRVMERLTNTNVLFLDACRDNPLGRNLARQMGTRSSDVGRGLAAVESGVGTLISFSTQPGNVALDGTGRNSPYAGALVKQLTDAANNNDLSTMLIGVRNDVMKETQRKQVPWEHSALTGRFYLGSSSPATSLVTPEVRDDPILLSVLRASHSEPFDFSLFARRFAGSPGFANDRFHSPVNTEGFSTLFNTGVLRELVFHSLLQGVRVANRTGEPFLFENNPEEDSWTESGGTVEARSPKCRELYPSGPDQAGEKNFEPTLGRPIWLTPHERDCRYQKFLFFLRLMVRYGINVEAVPATSNSRGRAKTSAAAKAPKTPTSERGPARFQVCFDPAVARENMLPGGQVDAPGACGNPGDVDNSDDRFLLRAAISGVVPIVRSPAAVFQFYGKLLAGQAPAEVSHFSLAKYGPREPNLFRVEERASDCFAVARYAGKEYCVPREATKNTKEIFTLLNALVAMSVARPSAPK